MKLHNLLHFTENHRFCTFRDFSLSSLDYKVLHHIYQPIVGPGAVGLYTLLFQQLPADRLGYSSIEQLRKLFLSLSMEPSERGRKKLLDFTSKLEALGLLQSLQKRFAKEEHDLYEFRLQAPLQPVEFFENTHLMMLLRDKIGQYAVLDIQERFYAPEAETVRSLKHQTVDLSVPFYEVFKLSARHVDSELEQALRELAPTQENRREAWLEQLNKGYRYVELITRFPRESVNRMAVENLRQRPDQLAAINYVAAKFSLTLQETCRLLDEDGIFLPDGELDIDLLQHQAQLNFRQNKQREQSKERVFHRMNEATATNESELSPEETVEEAYYLEVPELFHGQCDIRQYNYMLRNEPHTWVLARFFPGAVPERIQDIFARVDVNYKLPEEVINVLIHYLHVQRLSWTKPFIESVVTDMLGKRIGSYEQAVEYIRTPRDKQSRTAQRDGGGQRSRSSKARPNLPIASSAESPQPLSEEALARIMRKAEELDGNIIN